MDASPEDSLPEYTLAEVKNHGTPENLWMILYNKIYDVTSLVSMHPGGPEVLFDCGGVDATDAFEDVGHSKNASDMLIPFLIGRLPESDAKIYKQIEQRKPIKALKKEHKIKEKPVRKGGSSVKVLVLLALFACGVIIILPKLKLEKIVT